jgi:hypothetical protein
MMDAVRVDGDARGAVGALADLVDLPGASRDRVGVLDGSIPVDVREVGVPIAVHIHADAVAAVIVGDLRGPDGPRPGHHGPSRVAECDQDGVSIEAHAGGGLTLAPRLRSGLNGPLATLTPGHTNDGSGAFGAEPALIPRHGHLVAAGGSGQTTDHVGCDLLWLGELRTAGVAGIEEGVPGGPHDVVGAIAVDGDGRGVERSDRLLVVRHHAPRPQSLDQVGVLDCGELRRVRILLFGSSGFGLALESEVCEVRVAVRVHR